MPQMPDTQTNPGVDSTATRSEQQPDPRILRLVPHIFRGSSKGEVVMSASTMLQLVTEEVLVPLREWCLARGTAVSSCHVALENGAPTVFVTPSMEGYDFSLDRPLSDLEMDLHRKGYSCIVIQLPGGRTNLPTSQRHGNHAVQIYPVQVDVE
jgi:hypothetical protein